MLPVNPFRFHTCCSSNSRGAMAMDDFLLLLCLPMERFEISSQLRLIQQKTIRFHALGCSIGKRCSHEDAQENASETLPNIRPAAVASAVGTGESQDELSVSVILQPKIL